jgi:hypothetical protein
MEIGRALIEVRWLLGRPVKPGDDTGGNRVSGAEHERFYSINLGTNINGADNSNLHRCPAGELAFDGRKPYFSGLPCAPQNERPCLKALPLDLSEMP